MKYWLMKSEPDVFGIDDLKAAPGKTEPWDGVRNYQVRNMMRDEMQPGDLAFFYHSNCKQPGIAGIMKITRAGYPDSTAFDPKKKYYDPKSDPDNPRWFMVDVKYVRHMRRVHHTCRTERLPATVGPATGATRQPVIGAAGNQTTVGFHSRSGINHYLFAPVTGFT